MTKQKLARYAVSDIRQAVQFSIIIPVLAEQDRINQIIDQLYQQAGIERSQIIVVDGDPDGTTIKAVQHAQVTTLISPKGRAVQMNSGADRAQGQILLFLHADTQLPVQALLSIEQAFDDPSYVGGAFSLKIDSSRFFLRYIGVRANLRSRVTRIPYGDQAIYMRREYFEEIGGYRELPFLEDVDLMRRIKQDRRRIRILRDLVLTSARRWETEGMFYATFRNQVVMLLYYLGVSPEKLSRLYGSQREPNQEPQRLDR
jgi:rSAM/selenodomain-associated transferase 2